MCSCACSSARAGWRPVCPRFRCSRCSATRRLDELMAQLERAAEVVGDKVLAGACCRCCSLCTELPCGGGGWRRQAQQACCAAADAAPPRI